jgi:LysR family transcriptional regulator (chromosome initiation inhibitor)
MLDYKLIQALAMVIQAGGFDRAAAALNLTQSAVSQRVRLLEDQIGQILLARTTPPRPTAVGKRLIKHYHQVAQLEVELAEAADFVGSSGYRSLAIGINADSLATWFMTAVAHSLQGLPLVLDVRVDDQDETHRMLRDGDVAGCISTRSTPVQGCRMTALGRMAYRLYATPDFARRHFPNGITTAAVDETPALIYNRKDRLLHRFLEAELMVTTDRFPRHYLPSSEKFVDWIMAGLAYGLLPELQALPFARQGLLIDLRPGAMVDVALYWHCWQVATKSLDVLTRALVEGGRQTLAQPDPWPG